MTEKRFYVFEYGYGGEYSINNIDAIFKSKRDAERVVNTLNSLQEENEQLKSENKELQGKASSWKITASEQMIEQSELMKENVQLKQEIKELEAFRYAVFKNIEKEHRE